MLLLLLPILPIAPAQSTSDPWWGPIDRTKPTEGWAVRIPVVVENKLDYALTDPFVTAEIDLSKLLVEAGWTNQTSGAGVNVRGFTLDVDSIRVVPYANGFITGPLEGASTKPVPHRFYPAMFETAKFREFDASRAAGTILFQIPGNVAPQAKHSFYVYANPLEFGKIAPASFDPLEASPLDAFMWGTRGNVYLGYEPQQDGQNKHFQRILALAPGRTTFTVSTYELGGFRPLPSTATTPNPGTLFQNGEAQVIIPAGKPFKIEADKPILVWGYGGVTKGEAVKERAGYVPGTSGSFADDNFLVYGWGSDSNVGMTVRLIKAGPGVVNVRTDRNGETAQLTAASPTSSIRIPANTYTTIFGDGKFLVLLQTAGHTANIPREQYSYQLPATTGGPSGTDFYGYAINDEGWVRICPEANSTIRLVSVANGGTAQIYPEGTIPQIPPALFTKQPFCEHIDVPRTAPEAGGSFYEFYAVKTDVNPVPGAPVPFRAMIGAGTRHTDPTMNFTRPFLGHYGGPGGVDYYTYGDTGIFGHYNDTRVTVFEERERAGVVTIVNYSRALQRDEYLPLTKNHADATGRLHIVSTKPIAAVSLAPTTYFQDDLNGVSQLNSAPYARHVPGRPITPTVTIGALEFRGPLVDLVSPEKDGRQDFKTTGPGSPLSYRVDVRNLGRWLQNAALEDTIIVSCTTPNGWTVEGCAKEVRLSGASAERLNIVVTPSVEDVNQSRTILIEAKSKSGGAPATFKLIVRVEIRYGVGMWFDVEGGRKTIDPPIGLSPGETYTGTIVLKNTGSTQDRFDLRLEEPADGWEHELLLLGEPVTSVLLEGGESVLLTYRSTAPNAEQGPQNLVSLTAQSQSSTLAADIVYPGTRIRPKIDLEMTLAPQTQIAGPNETAVFNVTTRNKGNDVFTVLFTQDSVLPKGWTATLSTAEVSLNPNDTFVTQLRVTPVEGARAGDLASVKLTADVDAGAGRVTGDEVTAVVVVRRVYNLTTPSLLDAEAIPGEPFVYRLGVANAGNGQVEVELLSGAVDATLLLPNGDTQAVADWVVELQPEPEGYLVALNESIELPLRIEVPSGTPPGLYNLTFTTRLSREAVQNLTLPVQVRVLARVELDGADSIPLTPGRPMSVAYVARNTGNLEGTFEFTAQAPTGWNATFSPPRALLAPGEIAHVRLSLNATRDARDGAFGLTLLSAVPGQPATPTQVDVEVARPQLYLSDVTATGDLSPGELVLVTATIGNRGGITAENVSLALVVDGQAVDRVVLSRIPVGTTSVATLSWVATKRGGDVQVVLDPEHEIELASRDDTQRVVAFGSILGTPGPSPMAWVALVAALAVALALVQRRARQ